MFFVHYDEHSGMYYVYSRNSGAVPAAGPFGTREEAQAWIDRNTA